MVALRNHSQQSTELIKCSFDLCRESPTKNRSMLDVTPGNNYYSVANLFESLSAQVVTRRDALIPLRTSIHQLDETRELTLIKSQMAYILLDNCLDLDILTQYCLTDQAGHYTITETNKAH